MALDERIRDELDRAARPADPSGVYENLIRRRERRTVARKAKDGLLVVAVLAGSAAGFLALSRLFGSVEDRPASSFVNGVIAYASPVDDPRAAQRSVIWTMDPQNGSTTRLLELSGLILDLEWSPDGRRLAYGDGATITIYDIASSNFRVVDVGRRSAYGLSWSPDGTRLLATDDRRGPDVLYAVDLETEEVSDIYQAKDLGWTDWSPNGQRIAFVGPGPDPDGQGWDIYAMDADGSDVVNLTNSETVDLDPSWSPDGTKILFRSRRDGVLPEGQLGDPYDEIYVMNADGTDPIRLTFDESRDQWPVWSPDGTLIAYTSQCCDDDSTVVVMNADGSDPRRSPISALALAWQPISIDEDGHPAVTPEPEPGERTLEPTASPTPGGTHDIGLDFPVCDVTSVRGEFAPGVDGRAFVATEAGDVGGCPTPEDGAQVLAVDVTGDGLVDTSFGPLECDPFCSAFAAPDVDGDGTDELLIQNVQFSIAGLKLFEVEMGDGGASLGPVVVAPPGSAAFGYQGFEGGTEPQLWLGGDAGNADAIRCEPYDGGRALVSVTSSHPIEGADHIDVTETTFVLDGYELRVVDVRDHDWPIADDERPFLETGGCGTELSL